MLQFGSKLHLHLASILMQLADTINYGQNMVIYVRKNET